VVVVNDGSTDNSRAAVLGGLVQHHPLKLPLSTPPGESVLGFWKRLPVLYLGYLHARGPSFARNRGLEVGRIFPDFDSDIVAFLDSDDIYEFGKIAQSASLLRQYEGEVGVVYSDYDTIRPDGLRIRHFKEPFSRRRLLQECIVNCDSLVLRSALEKVNGFDEELRVCEDYDLWLRISEHYAIMHVAHSLVTIRVGPHSSTTKVRSEIWQRCWQRVAEKTNQRNQRIC
jgi:glycosyltransferase involved in cell wall biosynthesis